MENQLVTLLRIKNPGLGNFVKNKLEDEGIECFFTNEGLILGSHYDPNEVLLKVKAKKSEKAVKILLQIHKDYDLDKIKEDASLIGIKKILAPIKLSDKCYPLVHYALNLAKKINAEIKFLYVYGDPTLTEDKKHTVSWEKHVKLQLLEAHKKAQKKLVDFSVNFKNNMPSELVDSVKFHYRMLKGTPEYVISDACERYKPDVVLMGIGKTKDEKNEFLDKTVIKVVEHANYPVLAVPEKVSYPETEKLKVMYATNFYDTDNTSLNKLLSILQPFKIKIDCIHIDIKKDPELQQKVKELNTLLEKEYSDYDIHCKLFKSDDIIKGVTDFVKENDIHLISLSKQRRSAFYKMFHTNVFGKLLITEKVPMLIFPV